MDKLVTVPACCGRPMIYTMVFRGAELYCCKCAERCGLFGYKSKVYLTQENSGDHNADLKWFVDIATKTIPAGARKAKCVTCKDNNEDHLQHASVQEIDASFEAYELLNKGRPGV